MKIMQTLEGGLRVDLEDGEDWEILLGILRDATSCEVKLADRLGNMVTAEEVAEDWKEFIIPDLDATFDADLAHVSNSISAARMEAAGGPGPLWISKDDAFHWYSALNQARLAIEEKYHFGPSEEVDPAKLTTESSGAFLRSLIYTNLQSLLLDRVLR